MVPMKWSRFLKDVRCRSHAVPSKQIPSCFSVGFSQESSLCIKPVCGPAQMEDDVVCSVTLSGSTWLAFEDHGLNNTWQFHHAKRLKGCQTVKATTLSCRFSMGERLGRLTTSAASKGFSVLFKYQQQSESQGIPQRWFNLLPQFFCFRLNETF